MVGFNQERIKTERPGTTNLLSLLDQLTDLPACITYEVTAINDSNPMGIKKFFVPKRALESIKTGNIYASLICSKRIEKYRQRGFIFYQ